jgi:hypothetical protein
MLNSAVALCGHSMAAGPSEIGQTTPQPSSLKPGIFAVEIQIKEAVERRLGGLFPGESTGGGGGLVNRACLWRDKHWRLPESPRAHCRAPAGSRTNREARRSRNWPESAPARSRTNAHGSWIGSNGASVPSPGSARASCPQERPRPAIDCEHDLLVAPAMPVSETIRSPR